MEYWSIGVLEYWSIGVAVGGVDAAEFVDDHRFDPRTGVLSLHHSITPLRFSAHSPGHSRPAVSRPHMIVGQDSFVGG